MSFARVCRVFAFLAVLFLPSVFSKASGVGLPAGSGAQTAAPDSFPELTSEALDRTMVMLPKGFEGRQNLVFLSWARNQEPQIDTWMTAAQALLHASTDLRVYRMLVSPRENSLYRWWDNNSLRSAETDPEMLHWTVPLYTEKAGLRRSLGLAEDDHKIAVLLLDRNGRVLWKAAGASTEASRAGLLAAAQRP